MAVKTFHPNRSAHTHTHAHACTRTHARTHTHMQTKKQSLATTFISRLVFKMREIFQLQHWCSFTQFLVINHKCIEHEGSILVRFHHNHIQSDLFKTDDKKIQERKLS